jgi:hypothetical protein
MRSLILADEVLWIRFGRRQAHQRIARQGVAAGPAALRDFQLAYAGLGQSHHTNEAGGFVQCPLYPQ